MTKPAIAVSLIGGLGLCIATNIVGSNSHGHHYVFERGVVRDGKERRTVAVGQLKLHHVLVHIVQCIDQVGDIEADFDAVTTVVNVELINRFLLFRIVGRHTQGARVDVQPNALELVAGQNSGSLQRCKQSCPAQRDAVFVVLGDDAVVVGELAFYQFGHKLHTAKAELGLVSGKLHFNRALRVRKQAL